MIQLVSYALIDRDAIRSANKHDETRVLSADLIAEKIWKSELILRGVESLNQKI